MQILMMAAFFGVLLLTPMSQIQSLKSFTPRVTLVHIRLTILHKQPQIHIAFDSITALYSHTGYRIPNPNGRLLFDEKRVGD